MKFIAALASLALAQRTTDNDCLAGEGAEYVEGCRNLFYPMCDKIKISPDDSCNVVTYGAASIEWFSRDITVKYWDYSEQYVRIDEPEEEVVDENDWADWNWRLRQDDQQEGEWDWQCVQTSEIPEAYDKGIQLQDGRGVCGYKLQIINSAPETQLTVTVLRQSAMGLAVSAAAVAASMALF